MACARACTAGGCSSPVITSDAPRWAAKSFATARVHSAGTLLLAAALFAPATPDAAASSRANASISPARSGLRWSATAPVLLGMLSTTYRRFRFAFVPSITRREANSRAFACVVAAARFVLMPFRGGQFFQYCVDLCRQSWRRHRVRQNPQAAAIGGHCSFLIAHRREERGPA